MAWWMSSLFGTFFCSFIDLWAFVSISQQRSEFAFVKQKIPLKWSPPTTTTTHHHSCLIMQTCQSTDYARDEWTWTTIYNLTWIYTQNNNIITFQRYAYCNRLRSFKYNSTTLNQYQCINQGLGRHLGI